MSTDTNNNSSAWHGDYLDFLEGDHLVCATNGNGNADYHILCMFVRFGLGLWFGLLMVCSALISIKTSRIRKRINDVVELGKAGKTKRSTVVFRMRAIMVKLEIYMVALLFASAAMMFLGGVGIVYPPHEPLGILSDCAMATANAASGQLMFWAKQHSLQTRFLLPKNTGKQIEDELNKWSVSAVTKVFEQKLTPLSYVAMVVLLARGDISRFLFWTIIASSIVFWGFALMHALLFTRLAATSRVARVHNKVGGKRDVIQRRQLAVWRMFVNLISDLATVFIGAVAHPLAILVFSTHASSTRFLIFTAVIVPFDLITLTFITVIRLRVLRAKQVKLVSVTTDVNTRNATSFVTTSMVPHTSVHPSKQRHLKNSQSH